MMVKLHGWGSGRKVCFETPSVPRAGDRVTYFYEGQSHSGRVNCVNYHFSGDPVEIVVVLEAET